MATVNQEFPSAPMGRRVVAMMLITFTAFLGGAAASIAVSFNALSAHSTHSARILVSLVPLVGLFVIVAVFLFQRSRTARFRIEENCLVLGRKRFPLEGLVAADRDPDVLRWAFRVRGNGGIGAIQGRYWSRRIGKFDAFLTGTENAVVLRWPDHVVAVSPADTEFFIHCVRSAVEMK
jgi:Bacterial PH domain